MLRLEKSMVLGMCGLRLRDSIENTDFMQILGLNEIIDRLALPDSAHWSWYVLRRKDGHVLIGALEFEAEGQRK